MKRLLALLLCAAMVFGCCSFAAAEEKTHLTIWVPMDLLIEDYETNWMTKYLEEIGNFDLEFIVQPSGSDYDTKVNMALIAGAISDLPDIIITGSSGFSDDNVYSWGQNGTIIPLNEYYDDPEASKNVREAYERTGTVFTQQITSPDGNIYGFAYLNQSYGNEYPHKMPYKKAWLEKLNMEEPATTEELYQILKAVKETDLNGNGLNDEIPLAGTFNNGAYSGWFKYLMNAFVYAGDDNFLTVDDGVVGLAYTTEEWKEGLKYIKKLFDEGLILSETLTMDDAQLKALANTEEEVLFSLNYVAPLAADTDRYNSFDFMLPVKGPNGVQYGSYRPAAAKVSFVITANCKDPAAAFRLGDLMTSEYLGIVQRFGEPGVNWDYAKNVDVSKYEANIPGFEMSIVNLLEFWSGNKVGNASWRQKGAMVRQYSVMNGMATDPATQSVWPAPGSIAMYEYQEGGFAPKEVIPKSILNSDESDVCSEIKSNLLSYVFETTAAFLTGNKDIDADWDAFQAELKNIGSEIYVSVMQNMYDRMYK